MGAWGTSLYSNDSACDIRGDYIELLKTGKNNSEAEKLLIENNQRYIADPEEAPLFWFALADMQWNYGRLTPEVKEKALFYLQNREAELERWRESGEKQTIAWISTLDKLQEKLLSPQPPEKKVSKFRPYHCKWALGDVFAYRFSGDYSKETGFWGKQFVFRKVSETDWYPLHVIPVVEVFDWIGEEPPSLDELLGMPILPSSRLMNSWNCFYAPITTGKRFYPEQNLTWLGNRQGADLIPREDWKPVLKQTDPMWYYGAYAVVWESVRMNGKFEKTVIDLYCKAKAGTVPVWQPSEIEELLKQIKASGSYLKAYKGTLGNVNAIRGRLMRK